MSNKELFQIVKELKLPVGKYALFGSAPLGVRGLRECHDIDIVVMEDLWNDYSSKNGWEVKKHSDGTSYLVNGSIELWKDWGPGQWDINRLIKEAEVIDELPFVKLEYVVEWKKLYGRDKDFKDVETIEKFLRTQK